MKNKYISLITKTLSNNIFKTFSLYTFANALVAASMFLLIPFMTRKLDIESLGYVFLFQSFLAVFFIIVGLGSQSIIQTMFHKSQSKFGSYVSSAIMNSFLVWLFLSIFIYFNTSLFKFLFLEFHHVVFIAVFFSFFYFIQNLVQSIMQTMEMPKNYFLLAVTYAMLIFFVTIIYLYLIQPIWYARIWGIGIGILVSLLLSIYFLNRINLTFPSVSKMWELLSVGSFVIIHSFAMLLINQTDRLLIGSLLDPSQVGIFGVPAQLASSISVIGSGISMAFAPMLYKALSKKNNDSYRMALDVRNKAIVALFIITLFIVIGIFFLSDLILGQEFPFNFEVFLILISAYLLFGFYHFFSSYFYFFKKTKMLSLLTFSIAILNIVFSYLLIPLLGIKGAAIGTLLAYILGLFVAIICSKIILKKFDFKS